MQRRFLVCARVSRQRLSSNSAIRSCGSRKAEGAVDSQTSSAAGGKFSTASSCGGPKRKDWRTHKEVVYVKGVPVKGSLFKLPLKEQLLICAIFSITGSAALLIVRPVIRAFVTGGFLGLPEDSGWVNGPWLYRFLYVMVMYPSYSLMLFIIGSIFGRRVWFSFMIHRMWSRFLTKKGSERLAHFLDLQHY